MNWYRPKRPETPFIFEALCVCSSLAWFHLLFSQSIPFHPHPFVGLLFPSLASLLCSVASRLSSLRDISSTNKISLQPTIMFTKMWRYSLQKSRSIRQQTCSTMSLAARLPPQLVLLELWSYRSLSEELLVTERH